MHPELYVISDLHLCDGGKVEDFLPEDDAALAAFLDSIKEAPGASLIINGDFMDFVQVQPDGGRHWFNEELDASEEQSLRKLEEIMAAHPGVFDALGRFVGAGRALRFHYGNHDIDLVWPKIQARLRERLGRPGDEELISFGESKLVGGVYLEHGHQADKHINCFPEQPLLTKTGPDGIERLVRCWGTRFVEEFYNKIETLEGCGMLDNVRPRMPAAVIILKYAILKPAMYPMLRDGLRVILATLAELKTEQDLTNAASELGVSRGVVQWVVKVARWLGVAPAPAAQAKSMFGAEQEPAPDAELTVPSLQRASAEGEQIQSAEELAALAPDAPAAESKDWFGPDAPAPVSPELKKSLAYVRDEVLPAQPAARAVCVGHTHLVTAEGVPIPGSAALYYNSGSWTMTLDLSEVPDASFGFIQDPANYRAGRDYLHVTWADDAAPQVANRQWGGA
ncbi:MAG TPA: hypothetical protein VGE07_29355 [Herpetosiphonaceae bacterium]